MPLFKWGLKTKGGAVVCGKASKRGKRVNGVETRLHFCHETTARGATLLESIVLGVELCTVLRSRQGLDEPACGVLVV